jgi:adsorption protein B
VYAIDQIIVACLPWLAALTLISGLDDLLLDLACLIDWLRRRRAPPAAPPDCAGPEKPVAVLIPLWLESRVIGRMLEHNVAAMRYENYVIFAGAYPNDSQTIEALHQAEARFTKVHLALCPHDGPTSKADCLNWVYQRMLLYEQEHAAHFEVIVVHDAEDLIHPDELRWINRYMDRYGMVQIPVLPLKTPFRKFTHGIYCDEFAEFQTKDMPARRLLGGFMPSNGVGTGYARWVLEKAAVAHRNRIFDPGCLTEDYECGIRLHKLGCPQLFVPIQFSGGNPVATREFFPERFRHALKQRTRWVMGIALQAWERHGWSGGFCQAYWFWRDRKGLVGNPVSALANLILAYGIATWAWSRHTGGAWGIEGAVCSSTMQAMLWATLLLQLHRVAVRCGCVARIYGWSFAAGVPLRVFWANWINCFATVAALSRYASARVRGVPLVWFKTEHMYPSRAALRGHKRPLGEVLVRAGYLDEEQLRRALSTKPPGMRLGEHLAAAGALPETVIYTGLSLQQSVPFEPLESSHISLRVARALPGFVARRWRIIPFRIDEGRLYVAGPELPTDDMVRQLGVFTRLEIQFQYITPKNFERLSAELLGPARRAS